MHWKTLYIRFHSRRLFLSLLVFCVVSLVGPGCGRTVNRTAERRIREALPDLLGTARQYRVHVEGAPGHTLSGQLACVIIEGDDVELNNGLLLDHLHLELDGVDYDTGRRQVRDIKTASFEAMISENSMDQYLAGEAPQGEKIRNVRVAFGKGNSVTIAAERVTLGLGVPFRLSGPLRVVGKRSLEFDADRLVLIGIPITGAPLRFLLDRLVTGSNLSTLPFPVQLAEVRTSPGSLTLSGTADVPALLKRVQSGK